MHALKIHIVSSAFYKNLQTVANYTAGRIATKLLIAKKFSNPLIFKSVTQKVGLHMKICMHAHKLAVKFLIAQGEFSYKTFYLIIIYGMNLMFLANKCACACMHAGLYLRASSNFLATFTLFAIYQN